METNTKNKNIGTKFEFKLFYISLAILVVVIVFFAGKFLNSINFISHKAILEDKYTNLTSGYYKTILLDNGPRPNLPKREVLIFLIKDLKNIKKICTDSISEGCWSINSKNKNSKNSGMGFELKDGTLVAGINDSTPDCSSKNVCNVVSIDINGFKGPNSLGKDQFDIYYYTDKAELNY